ncbi:hypothetical protein HYDPIDRAFT_25582 [Hydnomerulius pinastri MD-312]|nr:hypothetical protein HYDPIDRAFT_25582 [Hydnomerulius pinastri MD-312]
MDGASAAATVVQLIQVTGQATLAIYQYAVSVQKADESRVQLLDEVQSFGGLLSAVLKVHASARAAPRTSHTPVDFSFLAAPDGPLKICQKIMTDLLGSLKPKSGSKMKRVEKLVWPFKEKEAIEMVSVLRRSGAGRSVIASAVIEEFEQHRDDSILAYFYCDFRQARTASAAEVLRSLLAQFLRQSKGGWLSQFPELVERKALGPDPADDLDLLCKCLLRASTLHTQPLVVIDALDECIDLQDLLDVLLRLNDGRLRLFLKSRTEQIIAETFVGLPSISPNDMIGAIEDDIQLHITKELCSRRKLRTLEGGLKTEISSLLLKKADGMFRWVQCQLDALDKCRSIAQIREVLRSLPKGLYEIYERILAAIDDRELDRKIVQRALLWLVAALRPMTILEVMEGVSTEDRARTTLVSFDESTRILALSHFSVQEYLTHKQAIGSALQGFRISMPAVQRQLALLSITYILLDNVFFRFTPKRLDGQFKYNTFLQYCLTEGFGHIRRVDHNDDNRLLQTLDMLAQQITEQPSKFHRIVNGFVTKPNDPTTCDWLIKHLAHYWGNAAHLAEFFLSYMTTLPPYVFHETLSYRFCKPAFIHRILQRFLTAALSNHRGCSTLHSLLIGASTMLGRPEGPVLEITQILLKAGCPTNTEDPQGRTPLSLAITAGATSIVRYIQQHGCTLPQDSIHNFLSCPTLSLEGLRELIDNGADVLATSSDGNTALHTLLANTLGDAQHFIEIVQKLVEVGCNISVQNSFGRAPIFYAVENHHVSVCQYLIELGAQLPDDILHVTMSLDMLKVVLKHRASELATYIRCGNNPLRTLLQEAGCDAHAKNAEGATPLKLALEKTAGDIVSYLLLNGAKFSDVRYPDSIGLDWATEMSWYPEAIGAKWTDIERGSLTGADVRRVSYLFRCSLGFPENVTATVLELAEYWACRSITYQGVIVRKRQPPSLALPSLPLWVTINSVRRITFWVNRKPDDEDEHGRFHSVIRSIPATDKYSLAGSAMPLACIIIDRTATEDCAYGSHGRRKSRSGLKKSRMGTY